MEVENEDTPSSLKYEELSEVQRFIVHRNTQNSLNDTLKVTVRLEAYVAQYLDPLAQSLGMTRSACAAALLEAAIQDALKVQPVLTSTASSLDLADLQEGT